MRIVFEPAEPEVREQCVTDRLIESCGQTVVVDDGTATQSVDTPSWTTQPNTEIGFSGEAIVGPRVAAKNMHISRGLVVTTYVKRISVEWAGTGSKVVRRCDIAILWLRKALQ